MEIKMISHTENPEQLIELAYLRCRNLPEQIDEVRGRRKLSSRFADIFIMGHTGLLEHASATFSVTGISRALTHQLVRHRIASYAQLSMRSVSPDLLKTIVPPDIQKDPQALSLFNETFDKCRNIYDELIRLGIKKEDARFIIPQGIETQIIITMNFRSWIHFLKLRLEPSAQWEIRKMAQEILKQLQSIAPNVFNMDYKMHWT